MVMWSNRLGLIKHHQQTFLAPPPHFQHPLLQPGLKDTYLVINKNCEKNHFLKSAQG